MSKKYKQISTFSLEGRFLNFILEDGYKIKHLYLATAEGELCIKLSKEARASVNGVLAPGSWIGIVGEQSVDLVTGEVKYKAFLINQAVARRGENLAVTSPQMALPMKSEAEKSKAQRPATILMCQKSDCMKQGGKALCQALQETLSDRGLQDQVTIKGTGCMKKCKAGPNLVMPDKTHYSRISARDVPKIVDRHFSNAIHEPSANLATGLPPGIAPEHPEPTLASIS